MFWIIYLGSKSGSKPRFEVQKFKMDCILEYALRTRALQEIHVTHPVWHQFSHFPRDYRGEPTRTRTQDHPNNHHSSHFDERICSKGLLRKWWYPQIIHFNKDFHYKSSILGVLPLFLETPICPSSYLEGLCLSSSASPTTSVWRCRPRWLRFRVFFRVAVGYVDDDLPKTLHLQVGRMVCRVYRGEKSQLKLYHFLKWWSLRWMMMF